MKKRIAAMMMTAALVSTSMIGCGSSDSTAYASETVYGEVTAVSDDGFTITVGTMDDSNNLTLGDETADITVTDATTYSISMSTPDGEGEAPDGAGEAPSGDDKGQKPDGQAPDGQAPEENGEAPEDMGEAPAQPEDVAEEATEEATEETTEESTEDTTTEEAPEQGEAPADGKAAEVSFDSIAVGTQVAITFDADGNVTSVEILNPTME